MTARSLAASPLRPQTNACRLAVGLPGPWLFRLGDGDWQDGVPGGIPVGVPGSWNDQVPGARDELGPAWYERRFEAPPGTLPLGDRDAVIRFGAVSYAARAWLNGEFLGGHEGGHLPFALPCAGALRAGENVLTVRVDGRLGRDRVPPGLVPREHTHPRTFHPDVAYDFFPFAGIHRRVELVLAPRDGIGDIRLGMRRDGDGVILTADVDAGPGDVRVTLGGTEVGTEAGAGLRVGPDGLWSPERPVLRTLAAELRRDGAPADRYTLRTGVRAVEVEGTRVLLNGAPVQLRGFGRHEDFPVAGRGAVPSVAARDLLLMRELGANSFRTAHYPCDEDTLDLADQLGLMVIAETPAVALYFGDEHTARRQELALASLDGLIARDRNRACVIAWSVANEPRMHYPAAAPALTRLCDRARELDPSRPASYATDLPGAAGTEAADIVFINAYPGWYTQPGRLDAAETAMGEILDQAHAVYPGKPVVLTEFGADAVPGTHADPPAMWTEEYQADLIALVLRLAAARPFVAGTHVWTFADFATAQAEHRPGSLNYKGVFTRDRAPKLAARRLREMWGPGKPPR